MENIELSDFNKVEEIFERQYGVNGTYFFDEIQNVPRWEKFIRQLVDDKKIVVLTGSNASLLSRELGTKLTGRHLRIELYPFSYNEFLMFINAKPSQASFATYLRKGGFPEFLKKEDPTILQELLKDILLRDIAVRYGIKNVSILKKLAIYLLTNVGKEFSSNNLKKMLEVKSVQSVIDYISYLEDAYLVFTIPKFSYSYKKQMVAPKKAYSIDNGLSNANSVSFSNDDGRMLENAAFLALRRKYKDVFYYSEKNECDFIIKEKEKITLAIQVCYELNEENEKREIDGLVEAMKAFGLKKGLILTSKQEDELKVENCAIKVIPLWKWLLGA